MKTPRIGIAPYEDMKARTLAIAPGEFTPGPDEPELWLTSIESLARVLSDRNRALIDLIIERRPQSLAELEQLSGRPSISFHTPLDVISPIEWVVLGLNLRCPRAEARL